MSLEQRLERVEEEVAVLRNAVSNLLRQRPESGAPVTGDDSIPVPMAEIGRLGQELARGEAGPVVVLGRFDGRSFGLKVEGQAALRRQVDAAGMVAIMNVMGSEPRLRIVQSLLQEEKSASEIGGVVGLEGGPLYHHLGELQAVGIVRQKGRGRYALTAPGEDLFYFLAALQIHWNHDLDIDPGREP